MSNTSDLIFLHARRQLVLFAAEASALPGLTTVEREQMRTIAGLAGLQLHRVGAHPNEGDARKVDEDIRRIMGAFHGLVGAVSRAVGVLAIDEAIEGQTKGEGEWIDKPASH